MANKLEPIKMY